MTENPDLLAYLGQPFSTAELDGQLWLGAKELGQVMNLADPEDAVERLYETHWVQFSDRLTAFLAVENPPQGPRLMRAFNLLGAYVLSTFAATLEAKQFRRWLLETLVYHQIDARREYQRLLERNAALERRVAALEADAAALNQAFQAFVARGGGPAAAEKDWLDGESSRLREQQQRTGETLLALAEALQNAPPAAGTAARRPEINAELDELRRLRHQQLDQVDILREIVAEIRSAQSPPPGNEYPPRMLAVEGPFPVYLGRVGGRDCPVVSARDLHAFLATGEDFGDWIAWLTADCGSLSERVDYEHLRWLHPAGTHMPARHYILTLNAVLEIVRGRDDPLGGHVRRFVVECRQRLAAWMADSLEPPAAPWPDFMRAGHEAEHERPMVLHFGDTPLRIVKYENGLPWLVAAEVCAALGIKNISQALKPLGEDEKGVYNLYTLGGTQELLSVSYGGLSTLTMRCHAALKPGTTAYEFRRWVTNDMLVEVFKTGRYEHPTHGTIVQPAATVGVAPLPALPAQPSKAAARPAKPKAKTPKPKSPAKPAGGKGAEG